MAPRSLTPSDLAKTPPTYDSAELPPYNPALQYAVSKSDALTGASSMTRKTTQTFTTKGEPKDADTD